MAEEKVFLDEGRVKVTSTRFISGEQTYPIAGITSVKSSYSPPKRGCATSLVLIGAVSLIAGIGQLGANWQAQGVGAIGSGIPWIVFAAIVGGIGLLIFHSAKPDHYVVLSTASGEVRALWSRDRDYVLRILKAVNEAIVYRG